MANKKSPKWRERKPWTPGPIRKKEPEPTPPPPIFVPPSPLPEPAPEPTPTPKLSGLPSAEEYWARKAWERQHQKELRKLAEIKSPVEKEKYLQKLQAKEQAKALEQWRSEVTTQYPAAYYDVKFMNGGLAQIYERVSNGYTPIVMPLGTRMLERGAQKEWLRREKKKRRGFWTPPKFKGVSKRFGGLAEYDIPYNVEEVVSQIALGWREQHLTPKEFTEKFGPFASALGLPKGTRITHVRRTERGFEMKYLQPEALDITKPWGVTEKDVEAWEKQGKLFRAHLARGFMAGGIWQKGELTPQQFREKYGVGFELPKESLITGWRRGPKGYEIKYMAQKEWETLPSYVKEEREPTFWEVPLTEHFLREMTTPRLKGYGEPGSKILGGPVGTTFATQRIASAITLGEATVGEVEEHVFGKVTVRSKLMTHEQLALSYGAIAAVVGIKYGPKIVKAVYEKAVPSHIRYGLSEKAFALKMRTIVPFYKKVISPTQLRLEHVYHEAMYKTPKWLGTRVFGPQRYGEIQAVLRTPYGTYESFHYAFPWKATPLKKYPAWLIEQARLRAQIQAIESSLAWGKTAYPGYGVSVEKVAEPLIFERKLALAERVPAYRTEYTPRFGLVKGKPEYTFTSWSVPTGKETMFTQRAALEFEQSLQRAMPTRYYIPATKGMTWQTFKGAPSTPFEQSLSKALATPEKVVKHGRQFIVSELAVKPATYKIAERVMKELGIAQTKTATTSFVKLRQAVFKPISVAKPIVETVKKAVAPTILHPFLWRGGEYPSKYAMEKSFQQLADDFTLIHRLPPIKVKELKMSVQKSSYKPLYLELRLGVKGRKEIVSSTLYHELGHHKLTWDQFLGRKAPSYEEFIVKRSPSGKKFAEEWLAWRGVPSKLRTKQTEKDLLKSLASYYGELTPVMRKRIATQFRQPKGRPWLAQKLTPVQTTKQAQKLRLKAAQAQAQRQRQAQVVMQKQALKLRQLQLSVTAQIQSPFLARPPYVPRIAPTPTRPPPPPPIITTPPFTPLTLPGLQRKRRRGPRWGAWFYREHAVARPRDVIGLVTGRKRKRGRSPVNQFNKKMKQLAKVI